MQLVMFQSRQDILVGLGFKLVNGTYQYRHGSNINEANDYPAEMVDTDTEEEFEDFIYGARIDIIELNEKTK